MTDQQPTPPFDVVAYVASVNTAMAEVGRKLREDLQAALNAAAEAFRPLLEYLREHLELADWEPEPDVEYCDHFCGRDFGHECLGDATTTLTVVELNGFARVRPMCEPCWAAVLDARAVATIEAANRALAAG